MKNVLVAASVLASGILLVPASFAVPTTYANNLISVMNEKAVDVDVETGKLQMWTSHKKENQMWRTTASVFRTDYATGELRPTTIRNEATGDCLTVDGDGSTDGQALIAAPCGTSTLDADFNYESQLFTEVVIKDEEGKVVGTSYASFLNPSKVIDIVDLNKANGASLQIWSKTGGANQVFTSTAGHY